MFSFLLFPLIFSLPPVPVAIAPSTAEAAPLASSSEEIQLSSKEDYIAYIDKEASKYGVSPAKVKDIVSCESQWDANAVGDHRHSYGLSQIYLPDHPDITKKQALDPKFALDYLMKHYADHTDYWSCEREV